MFEVDRFVQDCHAGAVNGSRTSWSDRCTRRCEDIGAAVNR